MGKKRNCLVIMGITDNLHVRLKLLAIGQRIPMYQVVENLLKIGLEDERTKRLETQFRQTK